MSANNISTCPLPIALKDECAIQTLQQSPKRQMQMERAGKINAHSYRHGHTTAIPWDVVTSLKWDMRGLVQWYLVTGTYNR